MTTSPKSISPIEVAFALTPRWMLNIRQFDALEIHPCMVIGKDSLCCLSPAAVKNGRIDLGKLRIKTSN